MDENKESMISKDIEHYFGVLFDKGFNVHSVKYMKQYMGYWEVVLKSTDWLVQISNDRGEITLCLGSDYKRKDVIWFNIYVVVYYISRGKVFIGLFDGDLREKNEQLQRLAKILTDYIDEIIPVMGIEFSKHEMNLVKTRKVVDNLIIEKYKSSKGSSK